MAEVNGENAFTQLTKLNILEELLVKGEPLTGGSEIVEVSSDYTTRIEDDLVIGTGTITVTLLPTSEASKQITIKAAVGTTITLLPTGTDIIEPGVSPLTPTTAITLAPSTIGEWVAI